MFSRAPLTVFKVDRRTRVYSVADDDGRVWVVKVFGHARWWQALMWLAGMHPAHREVRKVRRLIAMGLPVTPIAGWRMRWTWRGGVGFCVLPFAGESIFQQLEQGTIGPRDRRATIAANLAALTAQLLERGLVHRDYKLSNVLIDEHGALQLIDTDRVRRSRSRARIMRMLITLNETATRGGASRTDRLRFLKDLLTRTRLGKLRPLVTEILRET